ncbi:Exostosin family protein isoform 1 [Dorcoceras hygrometricum]|uniref:Exostosin family protein isoform 1 n=1 Tax=Dorcoceras hygrometricum TaxID=472368 RepID=A0A2Z6ZX88_9LAMI|nr:Exostosin family protein isoform 1 [Dorcoceras hygrometricum]
MVAAGRERRLARTVAHSRPPALRDGCETPLLAARSCAMMGRAVRDDARNRAPLLRRVKFFVAAAAGRPPLLRSFPAMS